MNQKWMKWGWLIFTLAGVVWIAPFGIIWLIQSRLLFGILAVALCLLVIAVIFVSVPWKYPNTKLWKLLLPPYGFFLLAALLLLYGLTGLRNLAQVPYGLWLIPCFTPFFTLGYRTWNSFSGGKPAGNQNEMNGHSFDGNAFFMQDKGIINTASARILARCALLFCHPFSFPAELLACSREMRRFILFLV